jgi:vitamin B12 transporter
VAGAAWGTLVVSSFAQNPSFSSSPVFDAETVVITASKIPQKPEAVGSAFSVLPGAELDRSQIRKIDQALWLSPGVIVATSGQTGAISSIFLRGTNSNQTQIMVDGIRISDANIRAENFLGTESTGLTQSIEVLRGPQSALYGGEAIGGLINLQLPRGLGTPVTVFDSLTGSFDTFGCRLTSSGEVDGFGYALSTSWDITANDRPHNDFANLQHALRLDVPVSEATTLGFTIRGAHRSYQSPGSVFEADPDNIEEEEFLLATGSIDTQLTEGWNTRLLAGWLQQDLGYIAPPFPESIIDHTKLSLDWRNTFVWNEALTTLIGVNYESRTMGNTGFGTVSESDSLIAASLEQSLTLGDRLSLTGGGRWEHYRSFGEALTWRGTAAYHVPETGTTFRGSAGTGFRAPSFFELYAQDPFFQGNPNLSPETSTGWDAGISQEIGKLGTLGLTWFQNDLQDLIVSDFSAVPFTVVNLASATTSGAELEFTGHLGSRWHYRLAYTYLQAEDDETGERLLRRPKHTAGFDVNTVLFDRLTIGVGGQYLEDRLDVDPVSFAPIVGDDYFVGRVYGDLQVNDHTDVHLSIENVADEEYNVIAGYPGRGLGVFGGLKIEF